MAPKSQHKGPDLDLLQEFLNNEPVDEVVTRLRETLGNRDTIREIFFDAKANQYLPMLDEARKHATTFAKLTRQVEIQCENARPSHTQTAKNK